MNHEAGPWTTHELELFHDGQLGPEPTSRLVDELRRDPALRARLAAVSRIDDAVRSTLLEVREHRPRAGQLRWRSSLVPASVLALIAGAVWLWPHAMDQGRIAKQAPKLSAPQTPHRSVRVVVSVPLSRAPRSAVAQAESQRLAPPGRGPDRALSQAISEGLASAQVDDTLELLLNAPPDRRRAAYRRLGDVIRSAQVAEDILDRLSPQEQLAACAEWAPETAIRSTVFARLQRLIEEPALAGDVRSVVAKLSSDPGMRSWLSGYRLLERG